MAKLSEVAAWLDFASKVHLLTSLKMSILSGICLHMAWEDLPNRANHREKATGSFQSPADKALNPYGNKFKF